MIQHNIIILFPNIPFQKVGSVEVNEIIEGTLIFCLLKFIYTKQKFINNRFFMKCFCTENISKLLTDEVVFPY